MLIDHLRRFIVDRAKLRHRQITPMMRQVHEHIGFTTRGNHGMSTTARCASCGQDFGEHASFTNAATRAACVLR